MGARTEVALALRQTSLLGTHCLGPFAPAPPPRQTPDKDIGETQQQTAQQPQLGTRKPQLSSRSAAVSAQQPQLSRLSLHSLSSAARATQPRPRQQTR